MRYAFDAYYSDEGKYAEIDTVLRENPRLILTGDVTEIAPNIHLYSCNWRERRHVFGSFRLTILRDGGL